MSDSQTTRVLTEADHDALVAETAAALRRSGGLVLIPTETVYGLVCRADDAEAVARLQALKGRSDKPFARLVPDLRAVEAAGARVPEGARRLAERYWPGPLTLVLDQGDTTIGYRVPGHPFALAVTVAVGEALIATSANLTGEPAATTFAEALAAVGDGVDLAIDGGDAQLRVASTVVKIASGPEAGPPQILREGFLERGSIERALTRTVVFVCTGNTCRSPMAEALFRKRLADHLGVDPAALASEGWSVASAGVAAGYGGPAAGNAISTMRERGLDISAHQSQPLSHDMAADAEWIVGLTPGHAAAILDRWPRLADKVVLLDPRGVPDPIGGSAAVYRECADHIEGRLEVLMTEVFLPPPDASSSRGELSPELFPAVGAVPAEVDPGRYAGGRRYLIGGEIKTWEGPTLPVEAVVCERDAEGKLARRVLGETAQLSGGEAKRALDAAVRAWDLGRGEWPTMPLTGRIAAIRAFCAKAQAAREEVAKLLMWEVGKPWKSALKEFDRTIAYIDDTIAALTLRDRDASRFRDEGGVLAMVRRAPLGVVLCMGPFNYPLNETYTTVIPALAMGNTCVIKLPKLGMLCNLPLLEALAESFPPGVVNVISGDGREVITPIIRSGQVDALAFIGSSAVAGIIEKQHPAPYRLTTILGMDAKNPAIVLPSADMDVAVRECLKGALSFNGQRCTALKLLFVHRSLAERFAARIAREVEELRVGMPWAEDVEITPLPEPGKAAWLTELLEDAVAHGAEVQNPHGGLALETFVFPAVLYPVSPAAKLYHEEQFGPLVPIVPFDDVAEVQRYVAESKYGQQASVFGTDPAELGPLLDALANQVCRINLNKACQRGPDSYPFGGRKSSAEGVLSVTDALDAFSLPAMVATSAADGRELAERIVEAKTSGFLRRAE